MPRPILAASSLGALLVAMVLPFTPAARWFGFQTPSLPVTAGLVVVITGYLVSAELLKRLAIGHGARRDPQSSFSRRPNGLSVALMRHSKRSGPA